MTEASDVRLVFGLVRAHANGESRAAFDALATWMRTHHGIKLEGQHWPTYRELGESVREGKSDIAWLPPVVYAWLAEGVNPIGHIGRGDQSTYAAALLSRADSKIRALSDLRGARAGWVDPWSAAGYVVPRIELARARINATRILKKETFYGSHDGVLTALAKDDCDVVGTYAHVDADRVVSGPWAKREGLDVHVIATFLSIPSDVIAARRNLGPREYEAIAGALRAASAHDEARPHLRALFGGDEVREGIDPGHERLRGNYERATALGLFD